MIKFENTEVVGWEAAIRGMRNPMNSWEKSDSGVCATHGKAHCSDCEWVHKGCNADECDIDTRYIIGPNDHDLMMRLAKAGADHRKFMRFIMVYVDITAPLYWWKEFDTYKVGTVANSCSTMHKIADKEFTLEDFSCEYLHEGSLQMLKDMIGFLNLYRDNFNNTKNKEAWWQMIQLLPSSYNQRRTVMLNYEVLANIYKSRKGHKLDEWALSVDDGMARPCYGFESFCDWIKTLPYSELIIGSNTSETVSGTDCEPEFLNKKFNLPADFVRS